MKKNALVPRWMASSVLIALIGSSVSCMTTYDVNGRPMQTVDPVVAVAGVAAAGLIGYAASSNHHDNHDYYRGGAHYEGGYYRSSRHCY